MPENITKPQINNWIVDRAKNLSGREIVLPYIARLERDNTRHTTVAIEIKPEDYALLSRSDFWEKAIRIKRWVGWRLQQFLPPILIGCGNVRLSVLLGIKYDRML